MNLTPIQRHAKSFIQKAYELAIKYRYPYYVSSQLGDSDWRVSGQQPPVTVSHWRVKPNGETTAHVFERGDTDYHYEGG